MVLTIFGASILGSGLVGNLLISIRCVLLQDKSLALALELTFLGLIVYIPGKIGYQIIAGKLKALTKIFISLTTFYWIVDVTCQFWSNDSSGCYLHDPNMFGDIMNIVSASLIGIGIVFDIFVFFFVNDLLLYGDDADNFYRPIPMQPMQQQHERQSQFYPSENDGKNVKVPIDQSFLRISIHRKQSIRTVYFTGWRTCYTKSCKSSNWEHRSVWATTWSTFFSFATDAFTATFSYD